MVRRTEQARKYETEEGRGARVVGIRLPVGGGEKARAVAKHLLHEQRPAPVKSLGLFVPDTQRKQ